MTYTVETVSVNDMDRYRQDLIELLMDSVNGGASVGFMPPLSAETADDYWAGINTELATGIKDLLVLKNEDERVIGSVQLAYPGKANASHRAEVQKLFVHSRFRRNGYAQKLMTALEEAAQKRNRRLLVLDTRKGDASESLYGKLGYQRAGEIPGYARSANGRLHTTVFLYKPIG